MFKDIGSQWGYLGFKDAHHPETWNPRMRLVEETSMTHAPEVDLFPTWLAGRHPAVRQAARRRPQGTNPALRVLSSHPESELGQPDGKRLDSDTDDRRRTRAHPGRFAGDLDDVETAQQRADHHL